MIQSWLMGRPLPQGQNKLKAAYVDDVLQHARSQLPQASAISATLKGHCPEHLPDSRPNQVRGLYSRAPENHILPSSIHALTQQSTTRTPHAALLRAYSEGRVLSSMNVDSSDVILHSKGL